MNDFNIDNILNKITQAPPADLLESEILSVIDLSKSIFIKEENVLQLSDPIIVVGDIHGQLSGTC